MKLSSFLHLLSYLAIRGLLFPFSLLPYSWIHRIGHFLGHLAFPILSKYRKRSLSNLTLAKDLHLSPEEVEKIAKESLGSLFITALEYGKLAKETDIQKVATCVTPRESNKILETGQGIIFFCAHLANWEILMLEGTSRMQGVGIGQPIANEHLYNWILRMREKFGGKIFLPKQAVKEGLRALKKGIFLGIVGDQGMPDSDFSSSFLGRQAWTSPLPALLSHRSGCPIIVATIERKEGRYEIRYSHPIWPDKTKTVEESIPDLMNQTLHILEEFIKKHPGQWLWQHNKWKQQGPNKLKKLYRQDAIAVILPPEKKDFEPLLSHLNTLRGIYPTEYMALFLPSDCPNPSDLQVELERYENLNDLKTKDYRFKLVFNFTSDPSLNSHFLKLTAFEVLTLEKLKKLSKDPTLDLSSQLKKVILHAR